MVGAVACKGCEWIDGSVFGCFTTKARVETTSRLMQRAINLFMIAGTRGVVIVSVREGQEELARDDVVENFSV